MLSTWLGVVVFLSTEFLSKGNTCQFDVKLKAMDVVNEGSKVKFSCSIPQCVTEDNPDTKFRMAHNGTEFGEIRKTEENDKGLSIAYFEKEFKSGSDAGLYACSALIPGLGKVTTNLSVIFLYDENAHQFIWANVPVKPPDVDRVVLIVAVGTAGAVVVVVIILVIVRKLMWCCPVRSNDPEESLNRKEATTEMKPFISNDKEPDDVQKTDNEQQGANHEEPKWQQKKGPIRQVVETKTVEDRPNIPVPSKRTKKLKDKSTKDKTTMDSQINTTKEQKKDKAAKGPQTRAVAYQKDKTKADATVNGSTVKERPNIPEEKKKFPVASKRKDKTNQENGPEHEPLKSTTEEEQETGLSSNPPNEDSGIYKTIMNTLTWGQEKVSLA